MMILININQGQLVNHTPPHTHTPFTHPFTHSTPLHMPSQINQHDQIIIQIVIMGRKMLFY